MATRHGDRREASRVGIRRPRLVPVAILAVLLCALGAAQGAGATIVWSKGGDIWAMNDDGSGQRLLIAKSAAPGMDSLRDPATTTSGATVFFTGETTRNKVTRTGLCGVFPFQYSCFTTHFGFYASGTYSWSGGTVRRLSPDPAYCFNCTDGVNEPEPRADGSYVGAFGHCQGFLDDGSYECVGSIVSSDGASDPAACNGETLSGDLPEGPSPDPVAPNVIVYAGCAGGGSPSALIVSGPNHGGERIIGCDDATQADPSWSPAGDSVVAAEGGTEAGLWVYGTGPANNGCFTGQLREVLSAPAEVSFSDPRFVGPDKIVFAAQGELWTVPAGCSGCAFPSAATKLTAGGDNASPSWTSDPLVAPPSPPNPPVAPTSPAPKAPPRDTTAPRLVVEAKVRQHLLRQGGAIVLKLRADEACEVSVSGKIVVPGKDPVLKKVSRSLASHEQATVRVKLSAKAKSAIGRAWRRQLVPTAKLQIVARDAGGNQSTKLQRAALLP